MKNIFTRIASRKRSLSAYFAAERGTILVISKVRRKLHSEWLADRQDRLMKIEHDSRNLNKLDRR